MRSQLARQVCRTSLGLARFHVRHISLATQIRCREQARRPRLHQPRPLCLTSPPRRTFFGKKPQRDVKDHRVLPGYDLLLLYSASETDNVRPPAAQKLVGALRDFFRAAKSRNEAINSTQAFCALRTLVYLTEKVGSGWNHHDFTLGKALRSQDIARIQEVARRRPSKGDTDNHLELARVAYKCMCRLEGSAANDIDGVSFRRYISALARYGAAAEAADAFWAAAGDAPALSREAYKLWLDILQGLADQGDEAALIQRASQLKLPRFHVARRQQIMTTFYAKRSDVDAVFDWYNKSDCEPFAPTLLELLRLARSRPEAAGRVNEIFSDLCGQPSKAPPRHTWDVILRWAVAVLGKDIDGIDHMIRQLPSVEAYAKAGTYPDVQTLNSLLETALEMKNPALAERFWLWSIKHNIQRDARSRALQLEYRLESNDFVGAHGAFEALMEYPREHDSETGESGFDEHASSVLNRYLRGLCSDLGNGQKLLSVLARVEECEVTLEPETTAALCVTFLKQDQQYDLMDTLSLHALQYSLEERGVVRNVLVDYCLDESNSTARVWDGYSLLREYFPETDRESRVKLMDAFFGRRKRPDMAVLVFGHMRAQDNPEIRPTVAVYTRALEQLGRYPDGESLGMVHNMLKMDTTIQPDTRLWNALMMAYTSCGDPETSLEFWREITGSPEGPTYDSLAIFFWTCEKLPYGDDKAREVWDKMMRMEIEVPSYVFAAYCGATAGNGNVDALKSLLKDMRGVVGYYPDTLILRVSYNALPGQELQDRFEAWAKGEVPELWARLEAELPRVKKPLKGNTEFQHPRDELKP